MLNKRGNIDTWAIIKWATIETLKTVIHVHVMMLCNTVLDRLHTSEQRMY